MIKKKNNINNKKRREKTTHDGILLLSRWYDKRIYTAWTITVVRIVCIHVARIKQIFMPFQFALTNLYHIYIEQDERKKNKKCIDNHNQITVYPYRIFCWCSHLDGISHMTRVSPSKTVVSFSVIGCAVQHNIRGWTCGFLGNQSKCTSAVVHSGLYMWYYLFDRYISALSWR